MNKQDLKKLKLELAINAKSGIDFILSAAIVWTIIAYIWTLPKELFTKSIWTFYVGMFMLPLAYLLSKALKTTWTTKTNPLQPLGMWLNFAQLFLFSLFVFYSTVQSGLFCNDLCHYYRGPLFPLCLVL